MRNQMYFAKMTNYIYVYFFVNIHICNEKWQHRNAKLERKIVRALNLIQIK